MAQSAHHAVLEQSLADAAAFERDGFIIYRGVMPSATCLSLNDFINAHLTETVAAVAAGALAKEEAYGAIAPPAAPVANRWNVLLPMNDVVRGAIESVLVEISPLLELAVGVNGLLCDLSALVSDPGSQRQTLHFDTMHSDNDDDGDESLSGRRRRMVQQKRLVTAFVALQDISAEMGPTLIVPQTTSSGIHNDIVLAEGDNKADLLKAYSLQGVSCLLAQGDVVLMDSRALHLGSANHSVANRRTLLDFAFVGERAVPSTYCECIKSSLKNRYRLCDWRAWNTLDSSATPLSVSNIIH